jgi:hypothetical protein
MAQKSESDAKNTRRMVGVDLVTDGLLEAIAKYDGSSKVHVIRQLVRSAARSHYGTIEAALLEVRHVG